MPNWVLFYRCTGFILVISGILAREYSTIFNESGTHGFWIFNFYTIWTNIFVGAWYLFAILWRNNSNRFSKLFGWHKGATTMYITVTMLVFHFLLSENYPPENALYPQKYANIINHYVTPVGYIVDWVLHERSVYKWRWVYSWWIFPLGYFVYTQVIGFTPILDSIGGYPYFFVNPNSDSGFFTIAYGYPGVLLWFMTLLVFLSLISAIYISTNKYIIVKSNFECSRSVKGAERDSDNIPIDKTSGRQS